MSRSKVASAIVTCAAFTALLAGCSSVTPSSRNIGGVAAMPGASPPLAVVARYQPAPTMAILVVPGFVAGREPELIALAKAECSGKAFCSVGFWGSDEAAPRRLKMSGQQVDDRIVQFAVNNRTGLSKASWNCKIAMQGMGDCA